VVTWTGTLTYPADDGAVPSSSMPHRLRRTHLHQWKTPHAPHCQENPEATNSAARLMLSARTGTVKAPPSPLTSTDRSTKVSNLRMGARGAKMRWEKMRQAWRETGDRTSTRLRALLPGGRSRGARKRPRPLDSADHSRSPRRSHRGRESARRGHPHVFHPPLAAEREQGTLGCFQSSCNSPESIFASLARGSLSYSAVTPTLG
jgi:hypothetical protein